MTHRRETLEGLTAKALRPIAADLGIVGASRMKKDEIISAIIAADVTSDHAEALEINSKRDAIVRLESNGTTNHARLLTAAEMRAELVNAGHPEPARQTKAAEAPKMPYGGHWAMSYPLAPGGDGNVMQGHADYCAAWGHATYTNRGMVAGFCPRCGDLLAAEVVAERQEEETVARAALAEAEDEAATTLREAYEGTLARFNPEVIDELHALALKMHQHQEPKFKTGDRFRITPCDGVWSVVELIDLDPSGGPGYAWTSKVVDDSTTKAVGCALTLTEDFLTQAYVTKDPTPEYFARPTRRGVETVIVERQHGGRVDYRIIDPRTGRRSAIYRLRAAKFEREYVKVSS